MKTCGSKRRSKKDDGSSSSESLDLPQSEEVVEVSSGIESLDSGPCRFWEDNGWRFFTTKVYPPYTKRLELPGLDADWGDTRWVLLRTLSERIYEVKLVKKWGCYIIEEGWDLVAAAECLQVYQHVTLEYNQDSLTMSTWYNAEGLHLGFAHGFEPAAVAPHITANDVLFSNGTHITPSMHRAVHAIWEAVNVPSVMYVCTVTGSQQGNKAMVFFSKEYSKTLPKKKVVALRFLGSSIAISGVLWKYEDGVSRISHGWEKFVEVHGINLGDVLIFRCYRGPNVWEVLVCRARPS